jgi:hypothetical protein
LGNAERAGCLSVCSGAAWFEVPDFVKTPNSGTRYIRAVGRFKQAFAGEFSNAAS